MGASSDFALDGDKGAGALTVCRFEGMPESSCRFEGMPESSDVSYRLAVETRLSESESRKVREALADAPGPDDLERGEFWVYNGRCGDQAVLTGILDGAVRYREVTQRLLTMLGSDHGLLR